VKACGERSGRAVRILIANRVARAERAGQLLAAFSYRGVLSRGFALVRDDTGNPLRAASSISSGMSLDIEFADGRVGAVAGAAAATSTPSRVAPASSPPAKSRKPGGSGGGQGSLFG
jgi:exodeoxyribonuclease VII large subunit